MRNIRIKTCALTMLIAVLAGSALTGCRGSRERVGNSGGAAAGDGKPRIALIMKSLANEFFATMAQGARRHHEQHADDYELIVNGIKDERDLNQQVSLVEQMVARGVDAIVIAPADSKALVPVLKRARNAGVVVVNIDNKLDEAVQRDVGVDIPFVGPDNRAGARMVGEYLAKQLSEGDPVAILEGIKTSFNGQQRRKGFEDAMNTAGARIVESQSAQWETNIANRVTSAMVNEHEDLKAILAANDSMALGALSAVKSAGKAGETLIVGFDNISAVQDAIREGEILATADQHADQLAVYGIEYAQRILDGGKPEDKQTPVDLITAEDFSK
ncbi:MAG: sugar ABC transporter substrate-binding protein [Planctomycetota bacterium]